jgi:hypothetical protein
VVLGTLIAIALYRFWLDYAHLLNITQEICRQVHGRPEYCK